MTTPATPPPAAPAGRLRDTVGLFLRGVAMGAADIVPGVSGGTVALVTGIYERLIAALGTLSPVFLAPLVRGRVRDATRAVLAMRWGVLVPVFGGVMVSALAMSRVVPRLMDDAPGPTYAFFFGLILAAVWAPFARLRRRSWTRWATAGAVAVGAWLFVGLQPTDVRFETLRSDAGAVTAVLPERVRDQSELDAALGVARGALGDALERVVCYGGLDPGPIGRELGVEVVVFASRSGVTRWMALDEPVVAIGPARSPLPMVFIYGVVAISAMILPGLSGAFLMLFFGQYHALLSSIHGVTAPVLALAGVSDGGVGGRPWLDDALFLGVFNLGVLLGLVLFSRAVRWLLHRGHDLTMSALIGLMLGGLRQPVGEVQRALGEAGRFSPEWRFVLAAAVVGAVVVTLLNRSDGRARRAAATAAPGDAGA